jgi:putative CocE/NonD family hydrolase
VKATSPQAPVSEWMGCDDFFHNGAFLLSPAFDFFNWFGWPRKDTTTKDFKNFKYPSPDGYEFFMNLGVLPNVNKKYFHDSVSFWNDMMNHGTWDSFWQERSILPHLKNLRPATLVIGGWYDSEDLYGTLKSFTAAEEPNQRKDNHLLMGPWAHSYWVMPNLDSLGYIKFGSFTTNYYMEKIEGPFFEYYLNNGPDPHLAKTTVFLTGANEWKTFESWPPKNIEQKNLFLLENNVVSFTDKKSKKEYDEYISDPAKPVPYTSEIRQWYDIAFPVEDQRFASKRPDVIVYRSEPLVEDFTIAGPITVELYGSTSGTDCDWIVKIIDVFPDSTSTPAYYPEWVKLGGYQMMVRGEVLRGKFRNSLAAPEPIKPYAPTKFKFEMQDAFHCFKKGHAIMVQIQSTWFPLIDRNPGKFMNIYNASNSDFQTTTQRIYHSAKYPSKILFDVLK